MLKTWIPEEIPEKEELKKRIKEAGEKLYQQQMKLKEHKLPVLVLFAKNTETEMGPIATGLGEIYHYTVRAEKAESQQEFGCMGHRGPCAFPRQGVPGCSDGYEPGFEDVSG